MLHGWHNCGTTKLSQASCIVLLQKEFNNIKCIISIMVCDVVTFGAINIMLNRMWNLYQSNEDVSSIARFPLQAVTNLRHNHAPPQQMHGPPPRVFMKTWDLHCSCTKYLVADHLHSREWSRILTGCLKTFLYIKKLGNGKSTQLYSE